MRNADRRCVALDVETTGLSPWFGHRIIEIGAVAMENGRPGREFHSLVNPAVPIPRSATRIHGITNDMLADAPGPAAAMQSFHDFFGDSVLVAHNAPFDIGFLQAEMSRIGRGFNPPSRCTLRLARRLYPDLRNFRLETVARHVLGPCRKTQPATGLWMMPAWWRGFGWRWSTMNDSVPAYYLYWGKACKDGSYHLLPYHCLDVAAVAKIWWNESPTIQKAFSEKSVLSANQIQAWVLFFTALHDIGKFDIRFQRKIPEIWASLHCPSESTQLSTADSKGFHHGTAGLYWVSLEFDEIVMGREIDNFEIEDNFFDFGELESDEGITSNWQAWKPWLEAVTGHHGNLIKAENIQSTPLPSDCPKRYQSIDKAARKSWLLTLETLF